MFNLIFSDGSKSKANFKNTKKYVYNMPADKKYERVTVYHDTLVTGFTFDYSDGSKWSIGKVDSLSHNNVNID